MRAYKIVPPVVAASLFSLIGVPARDARCSGIGLQALAANGTTLQFGSSSLQPGELAASASTILPETDAKNVFVSGDAADELAVFLF